MASDRISPASEVADDRAESARLRRLAEAEDRLFPPGEEWLPVAKAQALLSDAAFVQVAAGALKFRTEEKRQLWIEKLPSRIKSEARLEQILRTAGALSERHRRARGSHPLDDPETVDVTCVTALVHALKCWTEQLRAVEKARKDRQRHPSAKAPGRSNQAQTLRDETRSQRDKKAPLRDRA